MSCARVQAVTVMDATSDNHIQATIHRVTAGNALFALVGYTKAPNGVFNAVTDPLGTWVFGHDNGGGAGTQFALTWKLNCVAGSHSPDFRFNNVVTMRAVILWEVSDIVTVSALDKFNQSVQGNNPNQHTNSITPTQTGEYVVTSIRTDQTTGTVWIVDPPFTLRDKIEVAGQANFAFADMIHNGGAEEAVWHPSPLGLMIAQIDSFKNPTGKVPPFDFVAPPPFSVYSVE